jgi:hypothetical protein
MCCQSLFPVIDHLFHFFLDCWKFGVRECNGDGDWAMALNQFKQGVNLFSVSSIVVHEFEGTE